MTINRTFFTIFLISTLFLSCRQNDTVSPELSTKFKFYAPFSVGSSFSYNSSLGNYTNIVQSDTVMDSKVYKKIQNNKDQNSSFFLFNEGVYTVSGFSPLYAGDIPVELKDFPYLKDNLGVNETWTVSIPVNTTTLPYMVRYDFKIVSKDGTRTINGKLFSNVVEVEQKITNVYSTTEKLVSTHSFWFAKGVGLIESESLETKISSYIIK